MNYIREGRLLRLNCGRGKNDPRISLLTSADRSGQLRRPGFSDSGLNKPDLESSLGARATDSFPSDNIDRGRLTPTIFPGSGVRERTSVVSRWETRPLSPRTPLYPLSVPKGSAEQLIARSRRMLQRQFKTDISAYRPVEFKTVTSAYRLRKIKLNQLI
jgi:hypothetical protein